MVRYALAPRWWVMHLIVLALFVGCLRLAQWQWTVAVTPANPTNAAGLQLRNAFYAVQWVFFGLVGLWFWGRFLRDQRIADVAYARQYWAEQAAASEQAHGVAEPVMPTDNLSE